MSLGNAEHDSQWEAPWPADWRRPAILLSVLVITGIGAIAIDIPLARALHKDKALRSLHSLLESIEPFGQPTAIIITSLAIALCDVCRRRLMPRFLAASLGAGLAADVVKLFVSRTRPHHHELTGSALATFRGVFPEWGIGSRFQSFPSAHTATAVGFALALATLFPRGRRLFLAAAALVALQRIEAGAHFLSDTCFGAAVGYAFCLLVFRPDLFGSRFDRFERSPGTPDAARSAAPAGRLSLVATDE